MSRGEKSSTDGFHCERQIHKHTSHSVEQKQTKSLQWSSLCSWNCNQQFSTQRFGKANHHHALVFLGVKGACDSGSPSCVFDLEVQVRFPASHER